MAFSSRRSRVWSKSPRASGSIRKQSWPRSPTAGRPAFYEPDAAHIIDRLVPLLQSNDIVVVFSNGGFDGIHEKILARLRAAG